MLLESSEPIDSINFYSSEVGENFSHMEISNVRNSTDNVIDQMMDFAVKLEKDYDFERPSRNKDNNGVVLSSHEHSIEVRDGQNKTIFKNKMNSSDSVKIVTETFPKPSPSRALISGNHASVYKPTLDNNTVLQQRNLTAEENGKAINESCVVYVGNIPHRYSLGQLKERFEKFGVIKDLKMKKKSTNGHSLESEEMKRYYGFITYASCQQASQAIKEGNENQNLQFYLSFSRRHQFVGAKYKDLDGTFAINQNSKSSFPSQNNKENDYDRDLKNAMRARGISTHPVGIKCKT